MFASVIFYKYDVLGALYDASLEDRAAYRQRRQQGMVEQNNAIAHNIWSTFYGAVENSYNNIIYIDAKQSMARKICFMDGIMCHSLHRMPAIAPIPAATSSGCRFFLHCPALHAGKRPPEISTGSRFPYGELSRRRNFRFLAQQLL